jgi:hypothetical protein
MKRSRKVLIALSATLVIGVGTAVAASIPNGDFEKGTLSNWKAKNDGDGDWFVYKASNRELPPTVGGATLPKPFGKFAGALKQNGPGTNYLTHTIAVPTDATTLSVKLFWINDGGPSPGFNSAQAAAAGYWVFPGDWNAIGPPIQFFRLDLVDPSANGFTTRKSDILGTIFKPKIGTTKARSGGWINASIDVSRFAGKRVKLRLVEGDNSGFLNVGLDEVRFRSADSPTG